VAEVNIPAGWDLTSATCSDGSPVNAIVLGAGETVTCTFNNRQDGKILVDKVTTPTGSTQLFEFDSDYGANFFLDDNDPVNDSGFLNPGTYAVAEVNIPAGWDLTSATCSDGSPVNAIVLGAGETVTCTFNNTQQVGEGCTPGFWQGGFGIELWNEVDDPDWSDPGNNPIWTGQVFDTFFQPTGTQIDDLTMLEIVGTGGTNQWARKAARDLIAAYLNASWGLAYPVTTTEILADWADALDADPAYGLREFHLEYSAYNELGCSIGEPAPVGILIPFLPVTATGLLAYLRRRIT
jgi:hypothetical protein